MFKVIVVRVHYSDNGSILTPKLMMLNVLGLTRRRDQELNPGLSSCEGSALSNEEEFCSYRNYLRLLQLILPLPTDIPTAKQSKRKSMKYNLLTILLLIKKIVS